MNFVTLAARNLGRRKGRTALTVLGVAVAISLLFSLLSFNSGYESQLNREIDSLGVHLLAVPKGCPYEAASLIMHGGVIPKYLSAQDLASVREIDGIKIASPMLLHQFYVSGSPHVVYGVRINETLLLKPWWKVEGRFFSDDEAGVIMVGHSLAEKENLTVGQKIPFGPQREEFQIVGILDRTGEQDDQFHFLPLAEAQRIFRKQDRITTVAVKVEDVREISRIAGEMEKIPSVQVVTMAQITGTIMNLAASARTLLLSVIAVALVISAFGILNTLLMSINERAQEFGMMKAIGASGLDIGRMVMAETVFLTAAGGLLGVGASLVGSGLIESLVKSWLPYAPGGSFLFADPALLAFCLLFSVLMGLICGLYPAVKSSRTSPMEAIRGGME
ncbi:MAG: ABC transporter permease [Methanosarcinales archaeon]|nr:ABC transporter permease [Methanosarcinales archaeon]